MNDFCYELQEPNSSAEIPAKVSRELPIQTPSTSIMNSKDIIRQDILLSKTDIDIPDGTKYLSDIFDEFPNNCILNKGNTGCGGTTIALTNNQNYVVCVPTVNLIKSKCAQSRDESNKDLYRHEVFGVFNREKVSDDDITDYLDRTVNGVRKILVTYDSLGRLNDFINPAEYHLLIDEYHMFIGNYCFRHDAIQTVLQNFKKYRSFVFMSATPTPNEFMLDELRNIPAINMVWANPNTYKLKINVCKKGTVSPIVNLVKKFLEGQRDGNLYLFVNSTRFIGNVIDHPELVDVLSESNCKVIFSENSTRSLRIKRGVIDDDLKKINFLTSTAFEGIDINDKEGVTVVATNSNHEHTLVDISTTLVQVAGRLRVSKYKDTVEIFCKFKAEKSTLLYSTYKGLFDIEQSSLKKKILLINSIHTLKERKKYLKSVRLDKDLVKIDDKGLVYLDKNAINHKLYKYSLAKSIYNETESLKNEIGKKGMFIIESEVIVNIKDLKNTHSTSSLKQAVQSIRAIDERTRFINTMGGYGISNGRFKGVTEEDCRVINDVESKYAYIWNAIKYIGYDRMARLKYNTRNIKQALIRHSHQMHLASIVEHLELLGLEGKTKTIKEAKEILQNIYNRLGLTKKAKSTDLETYYNIQGKTTIKGTRTVTIGPLRPLIDPHEDNRR